MAKNPTADSERKKAFELRDFQKTVRMIFREVDPDVNVEQDVKNLTADTMSQLADRFLTDVKEKAGQKAKVGPLDIKLIVDTMLPPEMARYANAEATKILFLYEKGLLRYAPDSGSKRSPPEAEMDPGSSPPPKVVKKRGK